MSKELSIAAFFAGIGGIEEGFHSEGCKTVFFCEKDERAKAVLSYHYPDVPIADDITTVTSIPKVDIVTAGFPCQDLSQAGLKKGIDGNQSSLVQHLFRILNSIEKSDRPEWLIIENVSYMISLDSGNAIKYLTSEIEKLGYSWGYRVVDARSFGVPQRRLRLLLVASRKHDVRDVLFSQDVKTPPVDDTIGEIDEDLLYGFYWTEGKRGLGWTVDAVPTLKIGSKIGIPSPPAIWIPKENFFGTPDIRDAERLQGFSSDWTLPVMNLPKPKRGDRWHLVGNAVCVKMSRWLAHSLINPGAFDDSLAKRINRKKWPKAAFGCNGQVFEVDVGTWPVDNRPPHLKEYLEYPLQPLTEKGLKGFYSRAIFSELINYPPRFIQSMEIFLKNQGGRQHMSYAEDFNNELYSIEKRFAGGLSNTSTKKFDNLIKIVADFTEIEEEKIYITAATSRASNLWNRLAQGKPLTQHFSFALGIIDAEDLQGGISPASRFIGSGVGHYDAIALAVRRANKWVIGAVLDSDRLPIYGRIATAFPDVKIAHEVHNIPLDNTELSFAWYVGTTGDNTDGQWTDFSDEYIDGGIWVNGWDDKFIDVVKSIAVGDRIAIKSTFTQKKNLPFENHGKIVGAMRLKAIGTVTENVGDGKTIKVDWTRLDPFKTWFGPGVLLETIHRVNAADGYIKKQLLAFTFGDEAQDYSLCEERYRDDIDQTAGVDEVTDDGAEDDIDVATTTGDSEAPKKKTCFEVVRTPRTSLVHPLNFIIYGAPGTGKTYSTAEYALAIIENRAVDTRRKSYEERKAVMAAYNDYVRKGQIVFTTFHQSYGYEEFIQGLRPDTKSDKMAFITVDGVFKRIADDALDDQEKNYVIIIDEINRANISKVFGELITLIENDKRWGEVNETCATLQSGDIFAVPNNLFIIGTMNSADKSISLIDAALRRRFEFIEQYPNASLVDDPALRDVLTKINMILADSLESSDLLIGHSYFMGKTADDLCGILNNSIIPLLYEYYYDNKKKVIRVLTDALKDLDIKIVDNKISRVRVEKADVQE